MFLFETLKEGNLGFMKDVSNFIGIDSTFWDPYSFVRRNKTVQFKNPLIHKFIRRGLVLNIRKARLQSPRIIKKIYRQLNILNLSPKSEKDRMILKELDKEFQPYDVALAKTLNIDLSEWF